MVETIRICSTKRPEGWVSINTEDFNPDVHIPWTDELAGPPASEPAKAPTRRNRP